jgi:hypothetical protein
MTLAIPTATSIKMRFKELGDVDDPVVEFAIEDARADIGDGSNFAVNADLALVYLAAHYVACSVQNANSGGSGGTGAIASESIGRLSISYARDATKPEATADDKESTSYGRRYLEIVGGNFSGPVIA